MAYSGIPYATEQGISKRVSGNCFQRTENFYPKIAALHESSLAQSRHCEAATCVPFRLTHTVTGFFVTTGFVVVAVAAWLIRKGRSAEEGRVMLSMTLWL